MRGEAWSAGAEGSRDAVRVAEAKVREEVAVATATGAVAAVDAAESEDAAVAGVVAELAVTGLAMAAPEMAAACATTAEVGERVGAAGEERETARPNKGIGHNECNGQCWPRRCTSASQIQSSSRAGCSSERTKSGREWCGGQGMWGLRVHLAGRTYS